MGVGDDDAGDGARRSRRRTVTDEFYFYRFVSSRADERRSDAIVDASRR